MVIIYKIENRHKYTKKEKKKWQIGDHSVTNDQGIDYITFEFLSSNVWLNQSSQASARF